MKQVIEFTKAFGMVVVNSMLIMFASVFGVLAVAHLLFQSEVPVVLSYFALCAASSFVFTVLLMRSARKAAQQGQ